MNAAISGMAEAEEATRERPTDRPTIDAFIAFNRLSISVELQFSARAVREERRKG